MQSLPQTSSAAPPIRALRPDHLPPEAHDVEAPARSKAFADGVLARARTDLADAIRDAVRHERLSPEALAKRCGTSREAVAALLAGSTPSSLELALRMAGALGIAVEVRVGR